MDLINDCYGMRCNFGTIVNFFPTDANGLTALVLVVLMIVIAFIFWIIYERINLKVETNEFILKTNIPVDKNGTNGEAVKNILQTLVIDQRLLRPRRPLREL